MADKIIKIVITEKEGRADFGVQLFNCRIVEAIGMLKVAEIDLLNALPVKEKQNQELDKPMD